MSGTLAFLLASLCPALVISPRACDVKGLGRRFTRQVGTGEMGGRGTTGGGMCTYLGPWGSGEPWLAWYPVIPLKREQWRLQPSDLDALAGSSGSQLAIPALHFLAHQSTPGSGTDHTGSAGQCSLPSLSLEGRGGVRPASVPCPHKLSRCVQKEWIG